MLKDDFHKVMEDLWRRGAWTKGSNASFIALIPKVSFPLALNDSRPISLIGYVYKVVSKVLEIRIKKVLPKVIYENQFAFLGGRNMLDNVVMINEVINAAKKKK